MGAVVPIFAVVIFWAIVFAFAFWSYRHWLKVPTESELEHEHEVEAHTETHSAEEKIEQPAAH